MSQAFERFRGEVSWGGKKRAAELWYYVRTLTTSFHFPTEIDLLWGNSKSVAAKWDGKLFTKFSTNFRCEIASKAHCGSVGRGWSRAVDYDELSNVESCRDWRGRRGQTKSTEVKCLFSNLKSLAVLDSPVPACRTSVRLERIQAWDRHLDRDRWNIARKVFLSVESHKRSSSESDSVPFIDCCATWQRYSDRYDSRVMVYRPYLRPYC